MHFFLGFLTSFILFPVISNSLTNPSLFDDRTLSSYLDFYPSDQEDPVLEDSLDFSTSFLGDEDFNTPTWNDDDLPWSSNSIPYPVDDDNNNNNNNNNINPQPDLDLDLFSTNPTTCSGDGPTDQVLKRAPQSSCPNNFLVPDNDETTSPQSTTNKPSTDPAKPPDPRTPGAPYLDHASLTDFFSNRDQKSIRGYVPGIDAKSPCGSEQYTVCDSGDPYYRIPQAPPRYALEKCFICMFPSLPFFLPFQSQLTLIASHSLTHSLTDPPQITPY